MKNEDVAEDTRGWKCSTPEISMQMCRKMCRDFHVVSTVLIYGTVCTRSSRRNTLFSFLTYKPSEKWKPKKTKWEMKTKWEIETRKKWEGVRPVELRMPRTVWPPGAGTRWGIRRATAVHPPAVPLAVPTCRVAHLPTRTSHLPLLTASHARSLRHLRASYAKYLRVLSKCSEGICIH